MSGHVLHAVTVLRWQLVPGQVTSTTPADWRQDVTVALNGVAVAVGQVFRNLPGAPPPPGEFGAWVEAGPVVGVAWNEECFDTPDAAARWLFERVQTEDRVNRFHQANGHPGFAGYDPTIPAAPLCAALC